MSNSQYPIEGQERQSGPASELDAIDSVVNESSNDVAFDDINFGVGVYSNSEYWQQAESFKKGMYERKAFRRKIMSRAVWEAKRGEVRDEWDSLDEDAREREYGSFSAYVDAEGDRIWAELSDDQKSNALEQHAGISQDWTPNHWRMAYARHELSRSKGGRLLDDFFGVIQKTLYQASDKAKDTMAAISGRRGSS